jgi:predicted ester cyclase
MEQLQHNKLLVRRYYETVVNTGNIDALTDFISPDYSEIHEGVRHALGLEGARQHVLGVRRTYPDLHLTIEQQIAEDDWVVSVVTARGTHRGVWMGMKPTNKPVEMTVVNIDRVLDGRIVEHGGAANLLDPLLKIGAIRVADPVSGDAGYGEAGPSNDEPPAAR